MKHPVPIRRVHLVILSPDLGSTILPVRRSGRRATWDIHDIWTVRIPPTDARMVSLLRQLLRGGLAQQWGGLGPHLLYKLILGQTPVLMSDSAVFLIQPQQNEGYMDWVLELSEKRTPRQRTAIVETKTIDLNAYSIGESGRIKPHAATILRYYLGPQGLGS